MVAAVIGVNIAELAQSMPTEFAEWLLDKTVEEGWDKSQVQHCLNEKNDDGVTAYKQLYELMRLDIWNKLAAVIGISIANLAPTMTTEFAEWLLNKTLEDGWDKSQVKQCLNENDIYGATSYRRLIELSNDDIWNKIENPVP